jgi:hypothetical protein
MAARTRGMINEGWTWQRHGSGNPFEGMGFPGAPWRTPLAFGTGSWSEGYAAGDPIAAKLDPSRGSSVTFPLWVAAALFAMLPAAWLYRRLRRQPPGHCPRCGYDLRATPDRCPECGEPATTP